MRLNESVGAPSPIFPQTDTEIIFGASPFGDREIVRYNLSIGGELKTKVQYVLKTQEEEGKKFYNIVSLLGKTEILDSEVMFNANTYIPTYSKKVLHLEAGKIEASVVYGQRQANIHLLLPQEETFSLDYREVVYDNEQIIHLMRTISFEQRSEASFRYIYPFAKHIQTACIRLKGKDIVRVEAGEFTCHTIELIIPGQRTLLWYAENSPRQMIRYQSETQKMVLELQGYEKIASSEKSE